MKFTLEQWTEILRDFNYERNTMEKYYRESNGNSDILHSIVQKKLQKIAKKEHTPLVNELALLKKKAFREKYDDVFLNIYLKPNDETSQLYNYVQQFSCMPFLDNLIGQIYENEKDKEQELFKDLLKLRKLIYLYGLNGYFQKYNRIIFNESNEPNEEIKKDIKTIQNFQNLIKKRFPEYVNPESMFAEHSRHDIPKIIEIQNMVNIVLSLEEDLEKKHFNLFRKNDYYKIKITTKKEITDELLRLVKKYKIKGYVSEIKKFMHDIVPIDELSNKIKLNEIPYLEVFLFEEKF